MVVYQTAGEPSCQPADCRSAAPDLGIFAIKLCWTPVSAWSRNLRQRRSMRHSERMEAVATGTLHHVELWVANLDRAVKSWGWLLGELGYQPFQEWPAGRSWRHGASYIVVEQSPHRTGLWHDRTRPGLNHLAFHVGGRDLVDKLADQASDHGWRLMFADRHPYAGGPDHYAAYLENADGFEAELVASAAVDLSFG